MLSVTCARSLILPCFALGTLVSALPAAAGTAAVPQKQIKALHTARVQTVTAAAVTHQVRINFASAVASDSDLQTSGIRFSQISLMMPAAQKISLAYVNGAPALRCLKTLTKAGSLSATQSVTTADDVKVSFNLSASVSTGQVASTSFAVTPHINSNGTLTLALFPSFTVDTVTHPLSTVLTLANNSTVALVLPFANPVTGEGNTLLFVTCAIK